jgi:hypothetical protein
MLGVRDRRLQRSLGVECTFLDVSIRYQRVDLKRHIAEAGIQCRGAQTCSCSRVQRHCSLLMSCLLSPQVMPLLV